MIEWTWFPNQFNVCLQTKSSSLLLLLLLLLAVNDADGTKSNDICMVTQSRFLLRYVNELARGFRRITCRSTHFNMVKTESVDGKRCSADVFTIADDVTRNVAAIPFKAFKIKQNN